MIEQFLWTTKRQELRFPVEYLEQLIYDMWLCGTDPFMSYHRARWLNQDSGRFWTMDSYEGEQVKPQSLHKYLYVGSDPVNKSDPTGNDVEAVSTAVSIDDVLAAQTSPGAAAVTGKLKVLLHGGDVDVYVWNLSSGGIVGYGHSVGHVMVTKAGTRQVLLSQFPHKFGEPSRPSGTNTQLNWSQTVTEEGRPPTQVFRVTLANWNAFDAAVRDHASRMWWVSWPVMRNQTHCARAAYDALLAGGIPLPNIGSGAAIMPGTLGDYLDTASQQSTGEARWNVWHISTDCQQILTGDWIHVTLPY
jgi:RHS repeat-associated protein